MATLNKDLGAVTAYGFAKDGGYTGTVQQFESDLASIGSSLAGKADLVNGKVPASELPSFVDDVVEGYYDSTTDKFYENELKTVEITPEVGKIYVDLGSTPSATYRWSGSTYVPVGNGSGHTILNGSGTAMTQRDNLKFVGASVTDDSTNGNTVVDLSDSSNNIVTFTDASADAPITSGSPLKTIISLVKYKFANLISGHTILNGSGSAMNQRGKLQFDGLNVSDDGGNNKTVVTAPTPDYVDEQFNSSKTYSKGMTCISGNKRYRYINSTASSGHQPPNATYWEVWSIDDQLNGEWTLFGTVSNMAIRAQKITNNNIDLFSCTEIKFEYNDGYMFKKIHTMKVQDLLDAYNGSWAAPNHYRRYAVMHMSGAQELSIIMKGSGQSNEFNTHNIVLDGGGTIQKNTATDPAPQDPSCKMYVR